MGMTTPMRPHGHIVYPEDTSYVKRNHTTRLRKGQRPTVVSHMRNAYESTAHGQCVLNIFTHIRDKDTK